jgi:hypothetical protein
VPRALLGLRAGDPVEAPPLRRPAPFIAFGRLKKLAAVCGVPVIRSDLLVLLQPLDLVITPNSTPCSEPPTFDPPAALPSEEPSTLLSDEVSALSSDAASAPEPEPIALPTQPSPSAPAAPHAPRDLTDELDGLRFSPLSTLPAQFAIAKLAIVEALADEARPFVRR